MKARIRKSVKGSDGKDYLILASVVPHFNDSETLEYQVTAKGYFGMNSIKIMPPYRANMYVDDLAERMQTKIEDVKGVLDSFKYPNNQSYGRLS